MLREKAKTDGRKADERKTTVSAGIRRREFLGSVAAGAAATIVTTTLPDQASSASEASEASAQRAAAAVSPPTQDPGVIGPPSAVLANDETGPVPTNPAVLVGKTGSDFMVDVIRTLDLDYCATLPGSTFRALQESLINYGDNLRPQLLTCTNEDIAASLAHGYAKVANKPMMALVHGVVGLQHASMGIYDAWCDRVPMIVVVGNTADEAGRNAGGAEWAHSAQDNAAMVRDFVKWDDQPASLEAFAMSMVRAKTIATTIPCAPTLIVADNEMGESQMNGPDPYIPAVTLNLPPIGDPAALLEAAKQLVAAEQPVILADRLVRTQAGMQALVELAEALGAPVIDYASRLNMPTRHPLNLRWAADEILAQADVVLALEPANLYSMLYRYRDLPHREFIPFVKPDVKVISISSHDLLMHANFQDFSRYQPVSLAITGDGEATLPRLLEAVRQASSKATARKFLARAAKFKARSDQMHRQLRESAAYGWNDSPISVPRFCAELGYLIRNDDWALVTPQDFQSFWPSKLWNFDKHYQYKGNQGGFGIGYDPGASLGAAIALRDAGNRLPVAIMGDGAAMMNPGALWTAAHHAIPVLWLMHNNRAWHQELMHVQRMADRHARGISRAVIGTTLTEPHIDFAKLADGMGVWSEGPISDPEQLGPALQRALDIVRHGRPALLDVVSQGR